MVRTRGVAQRMLSAAARRGGRLLEIRHGDPLATRFAAFGSGSVIEYPQRALINPQAISIGSGVTVNAGVALEAIHDADILITIDDGCHLGFGVRLVSVNGIRIGRDVAIGHGATLADTIHDYKVAEPDQPAWKASLRLGPPLTVEDGAWIGNNTVITGGVTIGRDAIVGPNSAVTSDVLPGSMVLGNPARLVRQRGPDGRW